MITEQFLANLQAKGVKIWIDGDQLGCRAPKGVMTADIQQELKKRKTEILAFLKEAQTATQSNSFPLVPVSRDEELPLSFSQQRMWFLYQLDKESPFYNESLQVRIVGKLSVTALEQSINEIICRHEALRTSFAVREGIPFQAIASTVTINIPVVDLQGLPEASVQQIVTQEVRKPFDLDNIPLLRATLLRQEVESHLLILTMHHIITDGWSMGIFFKELEVLYHAFTKGQPNPLPELTIQYADFAVWQRKWLTKEVQEKQLEYWKQQLADAPPLLELPTDYPRPPVQTFSGATKKFQIEEHLTSQLLILSQKSGVTLFMTLLAAFGILLHRYSGQDDICIGSPFANRNHQETETLIGCFVNTLVLRTQIEENPSFSQFLQQIRSIVWDAHAHQDVPFEQVVEALQPERSLGYNPLFQVMFVLENFSLDTLDLPNISLTPEMVDRGTSQFDLSLSIWQTQKGLIGSWEYNSDLFEADTIARMTAHFQTMLSAIAAHPDQRIGELPLLTEPERHQLLMQWNNTQANYPQDKCIHQLFEEQVERTPDAVAVVFGHQKLTYEQLNNQANQLAHYLQSLGVRADVLVGLCVERSLLMIVGLLGILKAGGAYVPLDPEYPTERLNFMLEDTGLSVVLTQEKLGDRLRGGFADSPDETLRDRKADVICLDSNWDIINQQTKQNPTTSTKADNLAYVMYTSGSTGQPKGVAVDHRAVNRLVVNTNYIDIKATDVIAQASNYAFDAATFEIWGALVHGARLVGVSKELALSPQDFAAFMRSQGISVLFLTTALFNQIAKEAPSAFNSLRHLLFGGEAVDPKWVKEVQKNGAPQRLLHVYGPTENTTFSSWYLVQDVPEDATTIPIGRAIANTQVYILDAYLQPVPIGVPGELHIGGAGLARGYLNRPELTHEKFIPKPFEAGGSRLYKTGDLARYLPDGNIEYLGRIDNQVKIRGFRIELGEIEAVLSQHKDVQVACVIVREDSPGQKRLVAYVVPQKQVTLTISELRQFLANKLPGYMMPNAFVILESLPLTPNGKVDRHILKAPSQTSDSDKFIEARNKLELKLVQLWSKIIKVDKIGVHDNFFDLGGHSLLASYLMAEIKQQFSKDIPLTTLFQNPTIEQLATIIQKDSVYFNSSCLVAIQSYGTNPPFFCVPGAGGRPFYFYHLGRYLGEDQPLYSFENDLYEKLGSITRIEDIASIYIAAMQTVQPQGPYFLGGHSYGGNVAFEMAQQLHKQGQKVALLAIIDSSAPTYKDKQMLIDYLNWDHARWLAEVSKGLEIYLDKNVDISYEALRCLSVEEQLKYVLNYFKLANMLPPNAEITQLTNIVQAYKTSCLCLVDYVPKELYPDKLTVLRANEDLPEDPNSELASEASADFSLGWSEFSTEPVDIHFVLGNHVSIMAEPHVQVLAEQLKACIDKVR